MNFKELQKSILINKSLDSKESKFAFKMDSIYYDQFNNLNYFTKEFSSITIEDTIEDDITEMEIENVPLNTITTIPVNTVFIPSTQQAEPFVPFNVNEDDDNDDEEIEENGIHVVIDGLNFWCSLMEILSTKQQSLGLMEVDRQTTKNHCFDSPREIKLAFDRTVELFNKAVPDGTNIHIVVKKFGNVGLWNEFISLFLETFDGDTRNFYHLYEAHHHNDDYRDKECDDRLTVRLALLLNSCKDNTVYLVSNDYYRSLENHWNFPSVYSILTDEHHATNVIRKNDFHWNLIDRLNFVNFGFRICGFSGFSGFNGFSGFSGFTDNISSLTMQLTQEIVV